MFFFGIIIFPLIFNPSNLYINSSQEKCFSNGDRNFSHQDFQKYLWLLGTQSPLVNFEALRHNLFQTKSRISCKIKRCFNSLSSSCCSRVFVFDDAITSLFCMKTYFYLHEFSPLDYDRSLALAREKIHFMTKPYLQSLLKK